MTYKYLVIVESPTKAKTIDKYLGKNYKVVASKGHLRDLPKSKMGVDIDNHLNLATLIFAAVVIPLKNFVNTPKKLKKSIWQPTRTVKGKPSLGRCPID